MTDRLEAALNSALGAAGAGSDLLRDRFGRLAGFEGKGGFDMVTEADRSCERLIVERLHRDFPDHSIVGEEGAHIERSTDYCWYIDPLDGTANFVHKFPFFAISIALARQGQPVIGVVADPIRNECFSARLGAGARVNGKPIRVSSTGGIEESLLATVFPAHARESSGNIYYYQHLDSISHGVRRAGAAALDLAWVACGRLDALWGFGLRPWDFAVGVILVREAGGLVTELAGLRTSALRIFWRTTARCTIASSRFWERYPRAGLPARFRRRGWPEPSRKNCFTCERNRTPARKYKQS
ncbi:MAG: inositol monophosphatase [Acidobacteriota bacterium]|nr:inositol monophosphatase [Acidobacteriota bacterium]